MTFLKFFNADKLKVLHIIQAVLVIISVITACSTKPAESNDNTNDVEQSTLDMDIVPGKIYVSTSPAGASVIINDIFIGSTPINGYELEPGHYKILIEKEGYNVVTRQYTVKDEPLVINEILALIDAPEEEVEMQNYSIIEVSTTPSGADVKFDGTKVGVTPLNNFQLERGAYNLEISKKGYKTIKKQVVVDDLPVIVIDEKLVAVNAETQSATTEIVTTQPTSVNGVLNIASVSSGASVSIDGVMLGTTPLRGYELKKGAHTVTISKNGYEPITKEVYVGQQASNVTVTLSAKNNNSSKNNAASLNDRGAAAYSAGNYSEAVKYFRQAAEMGDSEAQNNLAVCYEFGKGVKKDLGKAYEWYSKAAAKGNAGAKENLQKKKFRKYVK